MGNSTPLPCKILFTENILKLCIRYNIGEMTHHSNFGFNRYSRGFSPNRRNYYFVTFLTVLTYFVLDRGPKSNRWTNLHALWLKRRVSAQGWSQWGLE